MAAFCQRPACDERADVNPDCYSCRSEHLCGGTRKTQMKTELSYKIEALPGGWTGETLRQDSGWTMTWSAEELAGLDSALANCAKRKLNWRDLTHEDVPLNQALQEKLARIAHELEEGRGFVKVEGLPVARYGDDQLRLLWYGLGCHLGYPRFQDSRGQLMREIKDEGGDLGSRHGRIVTGGSGYEFLSSKARTYGPGKLRFHTDRCDVVGLLCLGQAKSGGLSRIASSIAVHNAILEQRPDLLDLLYRPYTRSRLGEEDGGETATYDLPVFGLQHGKLTSHYSRTYIEAAQLQPGIAKLTPAQWEAIDLLAATAERLSYAMRLEPGDIQLLNSHVTYHAREAFEDSPAEGLTRRLLRLWLAMPNSRALPEDHRVLWGDVAAGALRGGIGQEHIH